MITFDDMRDVLTDKEWAALNRLAKNSIVSRTRVSENYWRYILGMCTWEITPEGWHYWNRVHDRLRRELE